MTFSQRAVEAAAKAAYEHEPIEKIDLTEIPWSDLTEGMRDRFMHKARAALTATLAVDGVALVDQYALDWLFGEGPDRDGKWFGETIGDGVPKLAGRYPRTYWWRSKFRAMLSAASAEPAPTLQGWQPIESAPKDGTEIIYLNKFGEIGFCYWSEAVSQFDESLWYDDRADDECCPLYWLPRSCLPPPPAASEGEERE